MSYANFHCHSIYSVRDAILRLEQNIAKCKEQGIAPGILDHGVSSGIYKFYKECKNQDVKKFTLGQEFYYAEDGDDKGSNYHLTVIAKNNEGYKNLCKLSTEAFVSNFYRKPRVSKKMLAESSAGLIIGTACLGGMAQQLLCNGQIDECNSEIDALHKMFKDDFFLEIHDHGIPQEGTVKDHFRNYAREKKIRICAGNDSHYLNKEDKTLHNIFKQLAYNSVGKANDDAFEGSGYHVLSYDEMLTKFEKSEIDATLEISDKCSYNFSHSEYHLPKFAIPDPEKDAYTYLKDMCYKSLKEKGLDGKKEYTERLDYELNMLHLADLENYLLIVSDYMNWCKQEDIYTSPGRGSMAGSIVSWLSGVTLIDPIKYELLFARAINPGRCLQYKFFDD